MDPPTLQLPLGRVVLDPADHAAFSLEHLLGLVHGGRLDTRPIEVHHIDGSMFYKISNGRHRYLAAIIRGDTHIKVIILRGATFTHTPGAPHESEPRGRVMDHRGD